MSGGAGPTWLCEHGYLDSLGCHECDPPTRGGGLAGVGVWLLVLVAVAAVFLGGRWVGDQFWPDAAPRSVTGTWCGQADEVVALNLSEELVEGTDASGGRVLVPTGDLTGELSFGGRDFMAVAGRIDEGRVVSLRTVGSALWFRLDGALVEDRLRLTVVDDAGDTGRVELRHC